MKLELLPKTTSHRGCDSCKPIVKGTIALSTVNVPLNCESREVDSGNEDAKTEVRR